MYLEDHLEKATDRSSPLCFQITFTKRRFDVWADGPRYSFQWMNVGQIKMNMDATVIQIELMQASIEIKGLKLELLYQAFHQEIVKWVKALPENILVPEATPGPFVKTIQVEPKRFSKLS